MEASGSVRAFVVPSSDPSQQESKKLIHSRTAEAEVFAVCAVAGVSCIGITHDTVLFQPPGTTLSVPLAAFADAAKAIAAIKAKLAEAQQ